MAEGSVKRRRDVDYPRITYNVDKRTFDRLFKEETLHEMKEVVRRKLGIAAAVPVTLSQIREGKSVDLEDDDDFEAFYVSAYASSMATIQVVVGSNSTRRTSPEDQESPRKRRRKSKGKFNAGDFPSADTSLIVPSGLSGSLEELMHSSMDDASRPTKKRRVTFEDSELRTTSEKNTTSRVSSQDATSSTQLPALEEISSVDAFATREEAPDTNPTIHKKTKSKKKKPESLVHSVDGDLPATDNIQSEARDTVRDNPVRDSITAVNEGHSALPGESQKPKKKRRASILDASTSVFPQPVDKPLGQTGNNDASRPAKKPKKKHSEALDKLDDSATAQPDGNTADPAFPDRSTTPNATQSSAEVKQTKKRAKITDLVTQVSSSDTSCLNKQPRESSTNPPKTPKSRQKAAPVKGFESNASPETEPSKTTPSLTNASSDVPKKSTVKGKTPSKRSETDRPPVNDKKDASTQGKTPKKTKNVTIQGQPMTSEAVKAATMAAIATVLARKGIFTSEAPDSTSYQPALSVPIVPALETAEKDKTTYRPLQSKTQPKMTTTDSREKAKGVTVSKLGKHLQAAAPSSSAAPQKSKANEIVALQSNSEDLQPTTVDSTGASQPGQNQGGAPSSAEPKEQVKLPTKCPVCGNSPHHVRSRCPIIKAGIRSMRKRLAELKEAEPTDEEETQEIISELERIIEKRSRKPADKTGKSSQKGNNASMTGTAAANTSTAQAVAAALTEVAQATTVKDKASSEHVSPGAGKPSAPSTKPVKPLPLVENDAALATPIPSPFLKLGDVSSYTDQDLEALIRGPKIGLAAVPDTDTSEEDEEDEQILEEDEEDPQPLARMSKLQYGDSSDEQEEDDDSEANDGEGLAILERPPSVGRTTPEPLEEHEANLSFKDINGPGNSSTELDMTGNYAAQEALDADLSILPDHESTDNSEDTSRIPTEIVHSKAPSDFAQQPTPPVEASSQIETDPIEPPEARIVSSQPSQPDPIVSDNDAGPLQSTPKVEVGLRTRSQRRKPNTAVPRHQEHLATPIPASQTRDKSATGHQSTRKTRSLTRLSELPVPPNPASVRIIKAPHSPNQKKFAQAEEEEEEEEESDEVHTQPPLKGKPGSTRTPAKLLEEEKQVKGDGKKSETKTPAKTPAKSTKGSTKSTAKAVAKGSAKPTTRISTRARGATIVPISLEPSSVEDVNGTQQAGEQPVADWEVLQESTQQQSESMVDELHSSLDPSAPHKEPANGQKDATSQEPLFLHSESQQSFPFSQYPDIVQPGVVPSVTNDSADEQEVEASVVKPSTRAFRSLTEISSSQKVNFTPYLHPARFLMPVEPVTDFYGQTREASEQSGTESDSGAEGPAAVSHVPKERLAGVANDDENF